MRTTVALLLLLCLCDVTHCDCHSDCLTCDSVLPRRTRFNTMVCLIECEGNVSPAFSWDFCQKALLSPLDALKGLQRKRSEEEVESLIPDEEQPPHSDLLLPMSLQRFDHVIQSFGMDQSDVGDTAYDSQNALSLEDNMGSMAGPGDVDPGVATRGQSDAGLSVTKRFGGFVKGRHGYKKIMTPGRSYQKRYGGFIGIRKSARKWNNQKRFSEFLKQYLEMSSRATEFNSVSEDLAAQSEI
ncbi:unnamed protein product [Knipowitschia caucasica]